MLSSVEIVGRWATPSVGLMKPVSLDAVQLSMAVPGMKQILEQSKSLGGFSGNLNSLAIAKSRDVCGACRRVSYIREGDYYEWLYR